MKPIDYIFEQIAGGDAFLGWLVIALAVGCFLAGCWLWLDAQAYVRRRRREERAQWLRTLRMEADEARRRAGLPEITRPVSVCHPSTPTF